MRIFFIFLPIFLVACSTGRFYKDDEKNSAQLSPKTREVTEILSKADLACVSTSQTMAEKNKQNTVIVHPGLLLFNINWDQSLAVESAKLLIKNGFARDFIELRDRENIDISELLKREPGNRFIGLQYSMGGQPRLIAATLANFRQASHSGSTQYFYYPILVDPFDIGNLDNFLSLDSTELGQMFIVVSQEKALLRPSMGAIPNNVLNHNKLHLLYAEDFGENWGHFDALSAIVSGGGTVRFKEIFFVIASSINIGLPSNELAAKLDFLKIKYAVKDARPVSSSWLSSASKINCHQVAGRMSNVALQ